MLAELIAIPTASTPLDALYYEPADRITKNAALLMHGNGMNFYTGSLRFLPEPLKRAGFASLAFNRHGHDTVSAPTRTAEGNAYQTVAESLADNETAGRYLGERGFRAPIVIGHSNGGLLAAHFAAAHAETPALVLLSAHCGGPQMVQRASKLGLFAGDRLPEISAHAHELVNAGRGSQLLLMPGWFYLTTAASFVDLETKTPVLLEAAPRVRCPTLYLRGDTEDRNLYPAEAFAEVAGGPVDVRIIDDCNHYYEGREQYVGNLIAEWLAATVGGRAKD